MTSQGSPNARFRRAIERGNLLNAEVAARELGQLNLADALDYCHLLARTEPARYERAALRWHARWEVEGRPTSLQESQLALICLQMLTCGDRALALSVPRQLTRH